MEPYFHLKGTYKTSGSAAEAHDEIEKFIEESKTTILQKGVPSGRGARIIGWDINDSGVFFDIESDRYLRAHDAFIRLRKPLAGVLGKKYRIGVRGVEVEEYIISMPSEQGLRSQKIPYVANVEFDGSMLTLSLKVGELRMNSR